MRHHWKLLNGLAEVETACSAAQTAAQQKKPAEAVACLVNAYNVADVVRTEGEAVFGQMATVFEKSRYPKGQSVGGRKFVPSSMTPKTTGRIARRIWAT
jgi:hypothetical protein